MEIVSDKKETIYRKDFDEKPRYTIGLSKKKKEDKYENGFMTVRFKQDVKLENKTNIMIKKAWLSFNQYENKTYPYIFISEFEIVKEEQKEENPYEYMRYKVESDIGKQIEISDEEIPF